MGSTSRKGGWAVSPAAILYSIMRCSAFLAKSSSLEIAAYPRQRRSPAFGLRAWMDKKVSGPQKSTRPRSSQEIRFLKDSEDIRCGSRTSWRERVRPIQGPTSTTNWKLKRPSSAVDNNDSPLQPFDLSQIPGDWSSRDIHVCVNGKLSESPESTELARSFARWKRTGSVQSEEDNEDSLLEEVLGLENLLLTEPCQTGGDQLRQEKVPLCWGDLDVTAFKSHSPDVSVCMVY